MDPQAVFHDLPTGQRLVGRAGYCALAAAWRNAFENARLEVQRVAVNGRTVDVDFVGARHPHGRSRAGRGLLLLATGRALRPLEVRDHLIASSELDFDVEELKRRLLGLARQKPRG